MSKEIDEKVVSMQFDNKHFMDHTSETMSRLEKLKQSLHLSGAAKGLENVGKAADDIKLSPLGAATEQVSLKFSALQVMATTALANITNSAINAGKRIVSALTIDPIKSGLEEYETQINAVQTILANTSSKGTTLDQVNNALDELNHYADMTIYNFTEMTRNIGTFTAAGVDLDTSVSAIKGIANLAAVSGSTSLQASTAMYQLSQALAAGKVQLMDWNSVVNAGMGGQVFQDALKETARVNGVAIDDMIEQHGSFRETLQEGWLTSEVLTQTLAKFTGDLSEEQLKSMGYTEEQIKEIIKLGQTANDAATKVKTFTQLIDTLKEAAQSGWTQTWEILIGDFEEAKSLWTSVSDYFSEVLNKSAEARNNMLQAWADSGGRDMMIESFKNVFKSIESIVKPVREAFREIFPRKTAEDLLKITETIKEFTSKLILSEKAQQKLKSAFKGLFAVIDIGVTVIKEITKGIMTLLGNLTSLLKSVLGVSGSFGDWISGIRNTVKETGIFSTVIGGTVKILQKFVDAIKIVLSYLKQKFVTPGFEGFLAVLSGIWNVIKFVADKIWQVFSTLGKGLLNAFRNGDIKSAIDIFNSGIIAAILLNIKKFVKGFTSSLGEISEVAGQIGGILDSVKGCFEAWQKDIQAKTLLKIATAIAILAVSLLVISSIDPGRLVSSLGAITVLFTELMASMAIFAKIGGPKGFLSASVSMVAMSVAVLVLASALKKISDINPDDMTKALLGVAGLSAIVVGVAKAMSKNGKIIIKGATSLIAFSLAVKILASACKDLSALSWSEMARGLVGVGVLMTAISIFLNNTKFSLKSISTGTGIVLLAASMKILASACNDFGNMNWESIGKGLLSMAVTLTLVTIALNAMPKNMLGIGLGLLSVSTALLILSTALSTMGGMSWEEIGKSLVTLGGALAILAISLTIMSGTLAGSAALIIASIAIGMLIPPLLVLSLISWEGIFKGLVTLAAAFTIIGVAGLVLGPLIPVILGLAVAIALLGVGILAAGVGLWALSAGLTALGVSFTVNAAAIVAAIGIIISGIIGFIPSIIKAIGDGIILIAKTIAGSVSTIASALAAVIVAICDAIIQSVPKIVKAAGVLLDALLKFILKYAPKLIAVGIKLIMSLLDGISQNIGKIVEKGVQVITNFIEGISSQIPVLIAAAFDFILDFINGIADAIETYTPMLMDACVELGMSIVKGVVKGLVNIPGTIWDGIKSVGSSIKDGFKKFFGIHSPAKEMMPIGQYLDEGLAVGLEQYKGTVVDATEDVGATAVDSMSNAISGISDAINSDIDSQPTIKPVLDLSDVEAGANEMNNMLNATPSASVLSDVGAINSTMNKNQNGDNFDMISAIKNLSDKIGDMSRNIYNINGITYDDGSTVADAVGSLVRAARIERRI